MSDSGIQFLLPDYSGSLPAAHAGDTPERIRDAARQFEALLLAQILRTARESTGGWLGSGGDPSGDCATGYAEEQLAQAVAAGGGLGLAGLIARGLSADAREDSSENTPECSPESTLRGSCAGGPLPRG